MILAAVVGKLVGDWMEFRDGLVFGIIAGLLIAPLVPQKSAACPLPRQTPDRAP
ncbi:MAG: hypothetical protein ACO3UM_14145 [Planctomycetota bacterium]